MLDILINLPRRLLAVRDDAFTRRHAAQTRANQISERERRQLRERDRAITAANLGDWS